MEASTTLAYLFGGVMLYTIIWIFYKPLKGLMHLAVRSAIGCGVLVVFNLLTGITHISLGVNLITAFITGVLGVPGLAMMIILKQMI